MDFKNALSVNNQTVIGADGTIDWARIVNEPTTLAGYGILDGITVASPATAGRVAFFSGAQTLDHDADLTWDSTNNWLKLPTIVPAGYTDPSGNQALNISASGAGVNMGLRLNGKATGNRAAYIDFVGDDSYTSYGFRILRFNQGPNTFSQIQHRGTGDFWFDAPENATIKFKTNGIQRLQINATETRFENNTVVIGAGAAFSTSAGFLTAIGGLATYGDIYPGGDGAVALSQLASTYMRASASFIAAGSFYPGDQQIYRMAYWADNGFDFNGKIAAGAIYPGGQTSYYLGWDGGAGLFASTHVVANGNFYPGNQGSYAFGYKTGNWLRAVNANLSADGVLATNGATSYYLQLESTNIYRFVNAHVRSDGYFYPGAQSTYGISYGYYPDGGTACVGANRHFYIGGNLWVSDLGTWITNFLNQGVRTDNAPSFAGATFTNNTTFNRSVAGGEWDAINIQNTSSSKKAAINFTSKVALGVDLSAGGGNDFWIWSIANAVAWLTINNSGYWGLGGIGNAGYRLDVPNVGNASGQIRANAHVTYSSRIWKDRIRDLDAEETELRAKVMRLRPRRWRWKEEHGGTDDLGLIAEEVLEEFPELVSRSDVDPTPSGYGLDYGRSSVLALYLSQQQERDLTALRETVAQLQAELEHLKRGKPS